MDPFTGFRELIEASNRIRVRAMMERYHPDGLVCSNDRTAAEMMQALNDLNFSVPQDVRVVAFDDVQYACVMTPALTTIHQPCAQLGKAAIRTMLERMQDPDMPARDILVNFRLIVRASSGANAPRNSELSSDFDAQDPANIPVFSSPRH